MLKSGHARVHTDSHDSAEDEEVSFSEKLAGTGDEEDEINGEFEKIPANEDVPEAKDYMEETRVAVKKFMAFSLIGRTYENIFILLSMFSCGEFIYQTYTSYISEDTIYYFNYVELALAVLFMWDWILCYFIADHKISHLTRCAVEEIFSRPDALVLSSPRMPHSHEPPPQPQPPQFLLHDRPHDGDSHLDHATIPVHGLQQYFLVPGSNRLHSLRRHHHANSPRFAFFSSPFSFPSFEVKRPDVSK